MKIMRVVCIQQFVTSQRRFILRTERMSQNLGKTCFSALRQTRQFNNWNRWQKVKRRSGSRKRDGKEALKFPLVRKQQKTQTGKTEERRKMKFRTHMNTFFSESCTEQNTAPPTFSLFDVLTLDLGIKFPSLHCVVPWQINSHNAGRFFAFLENTVNYCGDSFCLLYAKCQFGG